MSDQSVKRRGRGGGCRRQRSTRCLCRALTGQATQREAAEKSSVDRSTVVTTCRTAKQAPWMRWRRRYRVGPDVGGAGCVARRQGRKDSEASDMYAAQGHTGLALGRLASWLTAARTAYAPPPFLLYGLHR
jgi:hypothetical protein